MATCKWNRKEVRTQIFKMKAIILHEPGALAALCNTIGQLEANITNIQSMDRDQNFFTFLIDIEVRNIEHAQSILASLGSNKYVESVARYHF